jgi:hypothetical protein
VIGGLWVGGRREAPRSSVSIIIAEQLHQEQGSSQGEGERKTTEMARKSHKL